MTKLASNLIGFLILLGSFTSASVFGQDSKIPAGWKSVHKCHMRFLVPKTLIDGNEQGMDSCTAAFRDSKLSLTLDFGWYSGVSRSDTDLEFKEEPIVIDGRNGQFATYRETLGKWVAYIYVIVKPGDDRAPAVAVNMFVWVNGRRDFTAAKRIFRSIRFDEDAGLRPYKVDEFEFTHRGFSQKLVDKVRTGLKREKSMERVETEYGVVRLQTRSFS